MTYRSAPRGVFSRELRDEEEDSGVRAGDPGYSADPSGRAIARQDVSGMSGKAQALLECAAAQGEVWFLQAAAAAAAIDVDEAADLVLELATTRPGTIERFEDEAEDEEPVPGLDAYAFCDPGLHEVLVAADEGELARQRAAAAAALESVLTPLAAIPAYLVHVVAQLWSDAGCTARLAGWQLHCVRSDEFGRSTDLWSLAVYLIAAAEIPPSQATAGLEMIRRDTRVDLAAVAADAVELAVEPMLRAELLLAQAGFHAREHGYDPVALDLLRRALDAAEASEEKYVLVIAAAEYGRAVAKDDLALALTVLARAVELARDPANTGDARAARAGWAARLQLGVNLFDSGDVPAGFARIFEVCRSEQAGRYGVIRAMAWHYLAQVWESVGIPDEARTALSACIEACAAAGAHPQSAGWDAYARAQLARIDARYRPQPEPSQIAERATAARAAARAEQHSCPTLPPITDVLCAETLIELAAADPGHARAAQAIAREAVERARGGTARPLAAALTALARAELALGHPGRAERYALEAVELLDLHGGALPALRSEEVLATAARSLHAAGDPGRAGVLARRAADVVRTKFRALLAGESEQLLPAANAFRDEPVNRLVALLMEQLSP